MAARVTPAAPRGRRGRRAGRAAAWALLLVVLAAVSFATSAAIVLSLQQGGPAPAPAPTTAADQVAEGERLLAAGDPATAILRFTDALAGDARRAPAWLGRARARRAAKADPAAVRADVDRALEVDPRLAGALALLAELELERGDLRAAGAAVERALAATQGDASPAALEAAAAAAEVRRRIAAEGEAEAAAASRAEALLRSLQGGEALRGLRKAVEAHPSSAALRGALGRTAAALGRWDEALEAMREAVRLDPAATLDDALLERCRAGKRLSDAEPGAPPAEARWEGLLGGVWREEAGVLTGKGLGAGEFDLCGLVSTEPVRGARPVVRCELALVDGKPGIGRYAGVLVGGRDVDDFVNVYVFHHPEMFAQQGDRAELEEYRRAKGAWPKGLRVARHVGGKWQHVSTQVVHFADQGWIRLEVTLDGRTVRVAIDGVEAQPVQLDRELDGRAGVIKYYDATVRWRGFHVAAGR